MNRNEFINFRPYFEFYGLIWENEEPLRIHLNVTHQMKHV